MKTVQLTDRQKKLMMRSMRRGIKEMDIILSRFCEAQLSQMTTQQMDDYEDLLNENDQDLYGWISEQTTPPEKFATIILHVRENLIP